MKYKYEPNVYIVDYEKLKNMFTFDDNGEFETDDPKLIEWIRKNKPFLKPIEEPVKPQEQEKPIDEKIYKCKKCDFESTDKMAYVTHCRIHKKR